MQTEMKGQKLISDKDRKKRRIKEIGWRLEKRDGK